MLQKARRPLLGWPLLPWPYEVLSIGLGYGFYAVVRVLAPHRQGAAFLHAAQVLHVERWLHLDAEVGLNRWLTGHPAVGELAAYWYALGHFGVTPVVLVGLWTYRRSAYPALRSALVLASLGALVVYAGWPLAPPRYALPDTDDVLLDQHVLGGSAHGVSGLVNDLAAMPSLHVGWSVWVALVVVTTSRHGLRQLAWAYPLVTTMVVVASANHYLLDAVGGAAVVLVAYGLTREQPFVRSPASAPARTRERTCVG